MTQTRTRTRRQKNVIGTSLASGVHTDFYLGYNLHYLVIFLLLYLAIGNPVMRACAYGSVGLYAKI